MTASPRPPHRPGRRSWTLRRRLVVVVLALVAGVAAMMGVFSTLRLRDSLLHQLDTELVAASGRATEHARRHESGEEREPNEAGNPSPGPPGGLRALGQRVGTLSVSVRDGVVRSGLIDRSGELRTLSTGQQAALTAVPVGVGPRTVDVPGLGSYRVLAASRPDGDTVLTGLSTADLTTTVRSYVGTEAVVAAVGLALAAAVGAAVVRREMRPLERVAATATRVSELPLNHGEVALAERVAPADTDPRTEVGQVGTALNQLLGHVEGALAARHRSETQVRQFVADASHELRTPLASIRGYAELVRRRPGELPEEVVRAVGRVESEARRMTELVEDLLLLARLDAGRSLDQTEVDLTALAVDAVSDAHAAGPDHRWHLDLPLTDGDGAPGDAGDETGWDGAQAAATGGDDGRTVVVGDEHRLQQVLVNLLANARVHTPPGTTVVTGVRTVGGDVVVEVRDDGPGVPAAVRGTLFERFARADAGRSRATGPTGSTGLGLAIVQAVVAAHGGRVGVDSEPGRTVFTVTLPAA
ncbi:cell wall metabolism sensor histidine kinase WalK [Georgenia sp. SYP-B2076]|uniref:sensor histidine kinase n=1 Tax=Georgenia sp. SYP-B2076 TaxID=2495881 RepID=UPI001F0C4311|nr:HAMP domain-containing sensor histidine kinase [Georgenia sp. SYP-B2076]